MSAIAIIGMSCRLPGADSPDAFWQLLCRGGQAITEVPQGRWDANEYYDADPQAPGAMYTVRGGFLRDIAHFDPACFGISPREAMHLDPQQRIMLELAWEAFEDAGLPIQSVAGTATGVYLGFGAMEYALTQLRHPELVDAYTNTGYYPSIISNRVSYVFDLRGPSLSLDTACSSSLVSVKLACEGLRSRQTNMALAGGVNLMIDPLTTVAFCKLSALSPHSRCKTFDAGADGYVRGEGAGIVLLKRMEDAVRDGDRIYAVILGEAVNQDGRSNGLTAPSRKAQELVLEEACRAAACQPSEVQYVEAHGTGTFLGDPIEVQAIGHVMKRGRPSEQPLLIGSAKTNIGHLESAAGVAGLIKLAKCIEQGKIPPHLNLEQPNPHIPFAECQTKVVTELTPWPQAGSRRIGGVSAFGFGGTNAHVVLSEAPTILPTQSSVSEFSQEPGLLLISARHPQSLRGLIDQYQTACATATSDHSFESFCRASQTRRTHWEYRRAIVARDWIDASQRLIDAAPLSVEKCKLNPRIAFLFSGQGSQYVGMGQELDQSFVVFRETIDRCEAIVRPYRKEKLREVMYASSQQANVNLLRQTHWTQPTLFALQWGLYELWKSWGVEPSIVLGHSIGEIAAACAAGWLSWEAGLTFALKRGELMQGLQADGGMAAVLASRERVEAWLEDRRLDLCIAVSNSPQHTVISGRQEVLNAAMSFGKADGLTLIRLDVSQAFHSPLMDSLMPDLQTEASHIDWQPSRIPFISNLTGEVIPEGTTIQPRYFAVQARAEARYHHSLQSLHEYQPDLCYEIGPGSTCLNFLKRSFTSSNRQLLPSLKSDGKSVMEMLSGLAAAYEAGVNVRPPGHPAAHRNTVKLPTYFFNRQRYWESIPIHRKSKPVHTDSRLTDAQHPLLGRRIDTAQPLFDAELNLSTHPWLAGHRVNGQIIYPGAAYLEMLIEAKKSTVEESKQEVIKVSNIRFLKPLTFSADQTKFVQVSLSQDKGAITAKSDSAKEWEYQCECGKIEFIPQQDESNHVEVEILQQACTQHMLSDELYQGLRSSGLDYGAAFRRVALIKQGEHEAWGRIKHDAAIDDRFGLSPMLLDGCFHVLASLIPEHRADEHRNFTFVPASIESITRYDDARTDLWCHVHHVRWLGGGKVIQANIEIYSDSGERVVYIEKLRLFGAEFENTSPTANNNVETWKAAWQRVTLDPSAAHGWEIKNCRVQSASQETVLGLIEGLHSSGISAEFQTWKLGAASDSPSHLPGLDVLAWLPDRQEPGRESFTQQFEVVFKRLLASFQKQTKFPERIVFVTRGAVRRDDDRQAMDLVGAAMAGWVRSLRLELMPYRVKVEHWDLDPTQELTSQWEPFIRALSQRINSTDLMLRDGVVYQRFVQPVSRFPDQPANGLSEQDGNRCLTAKKKGSVDYLEWESVARDILEDDEVEIEVRSTGLNFRDVLNVLDMYPGDAGRLGGECAGIVRRVGAGVQRWKAGDAVAAIASQSFARYAKTRAELVCQKPSHLTFAEASSLPIASATAAVALLHFAKLRPGERVLIHAASGGVGLAAVRIALRCGAEVFATAGSERKRQLLRELGVLHVGDSRSLEFYQQFNQATHGEGVDVVLNSLNGKFLKPTFDLLREGGRFVEIGKIGVLTPEEAARQYPTTKYTIFDLAEMARENPSFIGSWLEQEVATYQFADDYPKTTVFTAEQTREAFRYMAQARHVGKIAVLAPQVHSTASILNDSTATCLITGGFGGIGQQLLNWLSKKGCKRVDLLLHRELKREEGSLIRSLQDQGMNVAWHRYTQGTVDEFQSLISQIESNGVKVRSVFHLAGMLKDALATDTQWDDFQSVQQAKSYLALALHQALRGHDLEHFVMFSSIASLFGSPGQTSYGAANATLDGLAECRNSQGLPGLSIQWGPWSGAGMAKTFTDRGNSLGIHVLNPEECFPVLDRLWQQAQGVIGVANLNPSQLQRALSANGISGARIDVTTSVPSDSVAPIAALEHSKAQWNKILANSANANLKVAVESFLEELAGSVLGLPKEQSIDRRQPLKELGLDSLMAVEIRNLLNTVTGFAFDATVLFDHPTIESLAQLIERNVLQTRQSAVANPESEDTSQVLTLKGFGSEQETREGSLHQMTEEELAAELARELEMLTVERGRGYGSN